MSWPPNQNLNDFDRARFLSIHSPEFVDALPKIAPTQAGQLMKHDPLGMIPFQWGDVADQDLNTTDFAVFDTADVKGDLECEVVQVSNTVLMQEGGPEVYTLPLSRGLLHPNQPLGRPTASTDTHFVPNEDRLQFSLRYWGTDLFATNLWNGVGAGMADDVWYPLTLNNPTPLVINTYGTSTNWVTMLPSYQPTYTCTRGGRFTVDYTVAFVNGLGGPEDVEFEFGVATRAPGFTAVFENAPTYSNSTRMSLKRYFSEGDNCRCVTGTGQLELTDGDRIAFHARAHNNTALHFTTAGIYMRNLVVNVRRDIGY